MTEEEYADFTERLKNYDMSQAEFIRQAITRATIRPIVTVSPVNDELLSAVGKLTAEYGKIGGNLNQIAHSLNEYGTPYNALSVEVRAAISDLAALKFEVLRKVGDAVGNIQSFIFFRNTRRNRRRRIFSSPITRFWRRRSVMKFTRSAKGSVRKKKCD